jgi:flagellar hook-associated protein FlgK
MKVEGAGFKVPGTQPDYAVQDDTQMQNDETKKVKDGFTAAMTTYQTDPATAKPELQKLVDMNSPMTVSDLAQSFIDDIAPETSTQPEEGDVNPPPELAKFPAAGASIGGK